MARTKATELNPVADAHNKFIYPVVRVVSVGNREQRGGSGVVIYSAPVSKGSSEFETYLLTNCHVIENLINITKKWHGQVGREIKVETRAEAMVEMFGYEDLSRITDAAAKRAELVAWDDQKDLGLLRLRSSQPVDFVAPLMTPANAKKNLFIFTPVYTVGCGLGVPPLVTTGHIGGFDFMIDNYPYTLTTAPSIYGNSGGGVFCQETGEVIGITARIAVVLSGFMGSSPVTHMSFAISPETIYAFLEEQIYDFIVNPAKTSAACAKERERLQKKAFEGLLSEGEDSMQAEAEEAIGLVE